jgi:DNA-binding NtrC family response regulator
MQSKLLRVLQEKVFTPVGSNREIEANIRIIAATSKNLEEMIKKDKFREDLFYRLNILPIYLPPLRERKDDIEVLCNYFVSKFNKIHIDKIKTITDSAMNIIKNYNWPGNIRELENVIERTFIVTETNEISVQSIPVYIKEIQDNTTLQTAEALTVLTQDSLDYIKMKEDFEKNFILNALKQFNGKINKTAEFAKIPKKTLLRKIVKYNIDRKQFKISN